MMTDTQVGGHRSRAEWVTLALLAISLTENLVLGVGVLRLSGRGTAQGVPPGVGAADSRPAAAKVGKTVPPLDAQRLKGPREQVDFVREKRATLLYVFTPKCGWCAKNLENLKTLIAGATTSHNVIALSMDPDVGDYVQRVNLKIPIYVNPSQKMFEPYGLGPTPLTLVIGPGGKVIKSWVGAYSGEMKKDVESYFGVELPGLVSQAVATANE
jgi:peroxiredoxin